MDFLLQYRVVEHFFQAVMHRVWQKEDKHQDVCKSDSYVQELEVHSILGQGGFSTVYAGTWHGSRAAIKVR